MKKASYWIFVLYTVCGVCYGENFCIANLSKNSLVISSLDDDTRGAAEIVWGGAIGPHEVEISAPAEFKSIIPTGAAIVLCFKSLRPKCTLIVARQRFENYHLELSDDVEQQISGNIVVTAVALAPLPKYDQLPTEIFTRLRCAGCGVFIEDKPNAMILELLSKQPFYYSPWRVHDLKQNLLAESTSWLSKCQVA